MVEDTAEEVEAGTAAEAEAATVEARSPSSSRMEAVARRAAAAMAAVVAAVGTPLLRLRPRTKCTSRRH